MDGLTSMGASLLSKVTSVYQGDSLLLSRSKEEDSASLFYSWGVYDCGCRGDEWPEYRRGSAALLPLFSLSLVVLAQRFRRNKCIRRRARRPRRLISSSALSDELCVAAA